MLGATEVPHSLSFEHEHQFVVRVAVHGRPSRRDLARELGGGRAAEARTEQDAELPVACRLCLAITKVTGQRRTGIRRAREAAGLSRCGRQ
jgi:hypothetical protein